MSWRVEPVTLFLDYDGTLHDCLAIYAPAFRRVCRELAADGLTVPEGISEARISRWLGLTVQEMWNDFMPELEQERQARYGGRIGEEMHQLIQGGKARLYPGTEETLEALRLQGCRMVFLSNCPRSYQEAHRQAFRLDRFFDAYLCAGDYPGLAKWEIYRTARDRFPGRHVAVGDRRSDLEIARRFGLSSIGCAYGYGTPEELAGATLCISRVTELPNAVATLTAL